MHSLSKHSVGCDLNDLKSPKWSHHIFQKEFPKGKLFSS